MKTFAYSLIALLCAATLARADWVIVQKMNAAGQENEITTKIKGEQARVDVAGQMSTIVGAEGMTMLMHEQKTAVKMDVATVKAKLEQAGQSAAGAPVAKPVATGQKEKVGDWDTEIYTWEGKMGSGRFWVAKDFPKHKEISAVSDKLGKVMGSAMTGLAPTASDFDGMVVKSEMTIMGQKVSSSLVSAKEETVDAKEFLPPQGYSEMKMPAMPGGAGPK